MVKQTVGLVFVDDRFYIGTHSLGVIGSAVEPDHEQLAITGTEFRDHFLAQAFVPGLAVAGKLSLSFGLEIVDTQQGVPADTDVDTRLYAVFAAGVDEVTHDVAFSVPPFHCLQAVRIDITLPESESGLMGSRENGKLGACRLGCLDPLVGIEVLRVEYVVILYRIDPVVPLSVYLTVEHVEVVMENHSHFRLVPFHLVRSRNRTLCLTGLCIQVALEQL